MQYLDTETMQMTSTQMYIYGFAVKLVKVLASAIGSLTNAQKVSDTFSSNGIKGITMPTIANYLVYLQESFIVQKAERYDIKGRKYISTPSKYYYSDMGLRNAFLIAEWLAIPYRTMQDWELGTSQVPEYVLRLGRGVLW